MLARSPRVRDDQRGAVAVFVAGLLAVLLLIAAFAIDLNFQRVAARDAQAVADLVALDTARALDGRTKSQIAADGVMDSTFDESVRRNGSGFGLQPDDFVLELGALDGDGRFQSIAPSAMPNAVRVVAVGNVDRFFAGGSGAVERSAVATAEENACIKVGSFAARVNTADSVLLGPLLGVLGTNVQLGVLDLEGLVGADVSLLGLLEAYGVGVATFDSIAAVPVRLSSFLEVTADVLRRESGQSANAQLGLLQKFIDAALVLPNLDLTLGDILEVDTAASAALDGSIDVFDLVTASIFAANGSNVLAVPDLNVGIPGVSGLSVSLVVGQRPAIACGRSGRTTAQSSQVELVLEGSLVDLQLGALATVSAPLRVSLELTPAEASLEKVRCVGPEDRDLDLLVGSGLLDLDVSIGRPRGASSGQELVVRALNLDVVRGSVYAGTSRSTPAQEQTIEIRNGRYDAALEVGSGSGIPLVNSLENQLRVLPQVPLVGDIVTTLLGGLTNGVLNPLLTTLVNPLLQGIDRLLLTPLLEALGVNVAGADLYGLPIPQCGNPVLQE